MKKIEALAILALILSFAGLAVRHGLGPVSGTLLAQSDWSPSAIATVAFLAEGLPRLFVQIGIAVWLFIAARRSTATPWVWALCGFMYGLTAPILFYLMQLVEHLKKNKECEPDGSTVRV